MQCDARTRVLSVPSESNKSSFYLPSCHLSPMINQNSQTKIHECSKVHDQKYVSASRRTQDILGDEDE